MDCLDTVTFLHIAAFIVYVVMAAWIFGKKPRTEISVRFFLFFIFLAAISLDRVFMHNQCIDIESAYIVYKISAFFWAALPPLAFLIVLRMSEWSRHSNNAFLIGGFLVYTLFMTVLHIYPGIHELKTVEFGFTAVEKGFWGSVYYFADWVIIWGVVFLMGLTIITSGNREKREQSRIILLFSILGIILMFVTAKARMIWFLAGSADLLLIFAAVGIMLAVKYYGLLDEKEGSQLRDSDE
ncbi:MAG TPA: hypothetical protein ENN55_03605 [Firmicutes bacterium]|nr:hypothetical protein [Bacillota bacterium]